MSPWQWWLALRRSPKYLDNMLPRRRFEGAARAEMTKIVRSKYRHHRSGATARRRPTARNGRAHGSQAPARRLKPAWRAWCSNLVQRAHHVYAIINVCCMVAAWARCFIDVGQLLRFSPAAYVISNLAIGGVKWLGRKNFWLVMSAQIILSGGGVMLGLRGAAILRYLRRSMARFFLA